MLSAKDVVKAHKVLSGVVVDTPLEYDHYLSEKYQAKIYLKRRMRNEFALLKFVEPIMPFLNYQKKNVSVV